MKKMTLGSYRTDSCTDTDKLQELTLQYNPVKVKHTDTPQYANLDEINSSAPTRVFTGMGGSKLELSNITVDGTGVVPLPTGVTSVSSYVDKLRDILHTYVSDMHEPPYVKVTWAELTFIGRCDSFDLEYTYFSPEGNPLRATFNIVLSASSSVSKKLKKAATNSPDLTHFRKVQAGDTLPLMTYRIYGDSSFYLEVARQNNLSSVNAIRPGDTIYFPPLKK